MSFDGQRIVIIGASAGIGEAAAKAFAARGAAVTITGRSKERLDQAAQRIGHPVLAAELDATSRGALDAFFATTGTIDHLVLSASPGAVGAGPIASLDEAALRQAFDGKFFAHVQAPVDFADLRMDNHYTGSQAYYRSKFALATFTFDLAEELADSGITVNCLHPASLMNTHMVRESMIPPMSSVASGLTAVMNLATGPVGGTLTGHYFDGRVEARAHEAAYDAAIRSRLRTVTAELLAPFLTSSGQATR